VLKICVFQEMASLENDTERSQECQSQLEELEERAKELDQRRTNNISAIRSALQSRDSNMPLSLVAKLKVKRLKVPTVIYRHLLSLSIPAQGFIAVSQNSQPNKEIPIIYVFCNSPLSIVCL